MQLSWWFFPIAFIEMAGAINIHNLTPRFFFIDWSHGPCGESSGGSTLNHHLDPQKKEFEKDFTKTSSKLNKWWKNYLQRGAAFGIPKIISFSFFHVAFFSQIRRILRSFNSNLNMTRTNSNSAGFAECWMTAGIFEIFDIKCVTGYQNNIFCITFGEKYNVLAICDFFLDNALPKSKQKQ